MNTKTTNPIRRYHLFFAGLGVVCALAIGANLAVRQGPVHDANAENDIRSIADAVNGHYSSGRTLPASLSVLTNLPRDTKRRLGDYDYTVTSPISYRLCATFRSPSRGNNRSYAPVGGTEDPGVHAQGRQCFSYTVQDFGAIRPLPLR